MISMPFTVSLATIPLVVFSFGYVTRERPVPVMAKPVMTETIRMVRMDDNTFRRRWSVVTDMPPAMVEKSEPLLIVETEVRHAAPTGVADSAGTVSAVTLPSRRLRSRSVRMDVCARHNMRRVMVGKYRWRCRR